MARRSARLSLPALQIAASVVLVGCPQLLDDEFRPDVAAAGAGGAGAGGSGGDGLGGSAGSTGGTGSTASTGGTASSGGVGGTGDDQDAAASSLPPRVIASRPAAGEPGVLADASIELTFSEPMDTTRTQAAYRSADLPADAVDFVWNDGGRVLVIDPREPLAYAVGADPANLAARTYSVELLTDAHDVTGRPLEPFTLSFATARDVSVTLPVVADPTLSGKYRSDATDGVGECATAQQTMCAGMGATTGTPSYRGFATFDLAALPAARLGVRSAQLSSSVSVVYGTPFVSLGALLLESVRFDAIGLTAFDAVARGSTATVATSAVLDDVMSVDVSPAVQADAAEGTRSQFRFRFTQATSTDAGPILLGSNWPTLQLHVDYLIP